MFLIKCCILIFIFQGTLMTSREKLTVICFDETYVSNRLCYDKNVIGPHKCVQTVVVRGTKYYLSLTENNNSIYYYLIKFII